MGGSGRPSPSPSFPAFDHGLGAPLYGHAVGHEVRRGSFVCAPLVDGDRYEVFGRYGEDLADDFVSFDVYDEAGNRLNEGAVLEALPSEDQIRALAEVWRAARTVFIKPDEAGFVVIAIGSEVRISLSVPWWPR